MISRGFAGAIGTLVALAWVCSTVTAGAELSSRIINGKESAGEPWMVALLEANESDNFEAQFCAGVLVHPYWVLTVAHCVYGYGPSTTDVAVGYTDLEDPDLERIPVLEVITHPDYDPVSGDYDYALLLLAFPVELDEYARVVDEATMEGVGTEGRILGWGVTQEDPPVYPTKLQEGTVDIVDRDQANSPGLYEGTLTERMLAAAGEGFATDGCSGDSGGPLLVPDRRPGKWRVAGLISFGVGCANEPFPGIYSRLFVVRNWILSIVYPNYLEYEQLFNVSGDGLDPDGDLWPTFEEYAYFGNPSIPDAGGQWWLGFQGSPGNKRANISFLAQRTADRDFNYVLRESRDLQAWTGKEVAIDVKAGSGVAGRFGEALAAGDLYLDEGPVFLQVEASIRAAFNVYGPDFSLNSSLVTALHPLLPAAGSQQLSLENSGVGRAEPRTSPGFRYREWPLVGWAGQSSTEIVVGTDGGVASVEVFEQGGPLVALGNGSGEFPVAFGPQANKAYVLRLGAPATEEVSVHWVTMDYRNEPPNLGLGTQAKGLLSFGSEENTLADLGGRFDSFLLEGLAPGDVASVVMSSQEFDPRVQIVNFNTTSLIWEDTHSGGGRTAKVTFPVVEGVQYAVRASNVEGDEAGLYEISVSADAIPQLDTDAPMPGMIEDSDAIEGEVGINFGGARSYDAFLYEGPIGGALVTLTMASPQFKTVLQVRNAETGSIVGRDEGESEASMESGLSFEAQEGKWYLIQAMNFELGKGGAYSLVADAESLDPVGMIAKNGSVAGSLETTDPIDPLFADIGIFYKDDYLLSATVPGDVVKISLSAPTYDAFLEIVNRDSGELVWLDDDSGGGPAGTNSLVVFPIAAGTEYLVRVTSQAEEETGPYTLVSTQTTMPGIGNTQTKLGALETSDRFLYDDEFGKYYFDDFLLSSGHGLNLKVEMDPTGATFSAYLEIIDGGTGEILASTEEDPGAGSPEVLSFSPGFGRTYVIRASSFEVEELGEYSIRVFL